MRQFSGKKVVAMDADIPTIHTLLGSHQLDLVLVRDLNSHGITYPLTDIAEGPFTTEMAHGYHVLHGIDVATKERKSLRIGDLGVVELSSPERSDWCQASLGAIRLYIPEEASSSKLLQKSS